MKAKKGAAPTEISKNGTQSNAKGKKPRRKIQATDTQKEAYAATGQLRQTERGQLRMLFQTYPDRELCRLDIVEAFKPMNKPISNITRMVYDAQKAGWLEVKRTGISPYSKKRVEFLGLVKPQDDAHE